MYTENPAEPELSVEKFSHELFKRLELSGPETELVREQGHTLTLDEVLEVLDPVNISKDDLTPFQNLLGLR